MKRFYFYAVAITITLVLGSCTRRLTDFTVISTKNLPIGEKVNSSFKKGNTRVKGEDVTHVVLCIPFGYPNMKDAIDRAIEATPGAVGLADGVVKTSGFNALVYGQNKYIVEGTPIFAADFENPTNQQLNNTGNQQPGNIYVPQAPTNTTKDAMVFQHKVSKGETLAEIAKLYNVKISDLVKWNNLSGNNLHDGQTLIILLSE